MIRRLVQALDADDLAQPVLIQVISARRTVHTGPRILEGITRATVMDLAHARGRTVLERNRHLDSKQLP